MNGRLHIFIQDKEGKAGNGFVLRASMLWSPIYSIFDMHLATACHCTVLIVSEACNETIGYVHVVQTGTFAPGIGLPDFRRANPTIIVGRDITDRTIALHNVEGLNSQAALFCRPV
jgi:hypothetical protein